MQGGPSIEVLLGWDFSLSGQADVGCRQVLSTGVRVGPG